MRRKVDMWIDEAMGFEVLRIKCYNVGESVS